MFSTASIQKLVKAAAALSVASVVVLAPVAARGEAALSSRGDGAKVGNWLGAPLVRQNNQNRIVTDVARIRIIERTGDQLSCRNTLFVPAHPRKCKSESVSPEVAYGANTDQALNASVQETVVRNPESEVVKIQPPTDEKAPSIKSTARLNVEEPQHAEPGVNPKRVQPKALEKDQPKPLPILSCVQAGTIVGSYGFNGIKPSDCDGSEFSFNASRDGKPFVVTLNSASGELILVRKVR